MEFERIQDWFEKIPPRKSLIIRDDQYELLELREILALAGKKNIYIRLIDSGKFNHLEISALTVVPFSFYTTDSIRGDFQELGLLADVLKKKGCNLCYFLRGELNETSPVFILPGIFRAIFISSRERQPNIELLSRLSEQISSSGSDFVYYHHGNPGEDLLAISQKRTWIHVSNRFFTEEDERVILDLARGIKKKKGLLLVHLDRFQDYYFLKTLAKAGAFLIFNLPPVEHSSKLYSLETHWRNRDLPEQAFYLYKEIMA